MSKEKFGIAVANEISDELDELVNECDNLSVSRSEVVEAILTAYLRADTDHVERVRELVI
jgi:metal-responsive CopG/Arc/MetJ family transcriptional regulator